MSPACKYCHVRKGADTKQWASERQRIGTNMETDPSLCFHKCQCPFRVPELNTAEQRTEEPEDSSIVDMRNRFASSFWLLLVVPGHAQVPVSILAQTQVCWFLATSISLQTPKLGWRGTQNSPLLLPPLLHSHSPCSSETMAALAHAQQGSNQQVLHHEWEMMGQDRNKELSRLQVAQELIFHLAHWFSSHPVASVQFPLDSANYYELQENKLNKEAILSLLLWNLHIYG